MLPDDEEEDHVGDTNGEEVRGSNHSDQMVSSAPIIPAATEKKGAQEVQQAATSTSFVKPKKKPGTDENRGNPLCPSSSSTIVILNT